MQALSSSSMHRAASAQSRRPSACRAQAGRQTVRTARFLRPGTQLRSRQGVVGACKALNDKNEFDVDNSAPPEKLAEELGPREDDVGDSEPGEGCQALVVACALAH